MYVPEKVQSPVKIDWERKLCSYNSK